MIKLSSCCKQMSNQLQLTLSFSVSNNKLALYFCFCFRRLRDMDFHFSQLALLTTRFKVFWPQELMMVPYECILILQHAFPCKLTIMNLKVFPLETPIFVLLVCFMASQCNKFLFFTQTNCPKTYVSFNNITRASFNTS